MSELPSKRRRLSEGGSPPRSSSSLPSSAPSQGILCIVCNKKYGPQQLEPTCDQLETAISKAFWKGMGIQIDSEDEDDITFPFCPSCREKAIGHSQTLSEYESSCALFQTSVKNLAESTMKASGVDGKDDKQEEKESENEDEVEPNYLEVLKEAVLKQLNSVDDPVLADKQ